ncbi:MAG TPA: response regulator [Anaerolineaceae bacterium]
MLAPIRDIVLVVNNDPFTNDLISRQVLQPAGYRTEVVSEASLALKAAIETQPDVIIASTTLPGLSGKDLMIMLRSQGLDVPVIVLVERNAEKDIIQAFRLGAVDYLVSPVREAEVLAVVERALKAVHARRERERLEQQLQRTNQELQQRVRELTTIAAMGKALTSITDEALLFEKILDGAVQVTGAEIAWFMLRDEVSKNFLLVAHRNLPPELSTRLHKGWDDGVSVLVVRSGKILALHGDLLRRLRVYTLGQSVLAVPLKSQNQVIGTLVMMRREAIPFGESEKGLLEAIADYATIALDNARLFLAVEERMRSRQVETAPTEGDVDAKAAAVRSFNREQGEMIESTMDTLEKLARVPASAWTADQRQHLIRLQEQIQRLVKIAEATAPLAESQAQRFTNPKSP